VSVTSEMIDHMTTATTDIPARLKKAGEQLAAARATVRAIAQEAHAAGFSEVAIAEALDVDRGSVRAWIGKPRKERR
jgi:ribosomal protein L18